MKHKGNKAIITEQEIQAALAKFTAHGGLIKKLPPEVVPAHNLVGGRFAVYETIQDTSSAGTSE
jgi:hypothetical protein